MYPQRELNRLAACKAALRMDIAFRRDQCAEAAIAAARPLEWLDRMLAIWRRLPPAALFGAVPLGFLVRRALFPRARIPSLLLRWGVLVFGAVRIISSAVRARQDA